MRCEHILETIHSSNVNVYALFESGSDLGAGALNGKNPPEIRHWYQLRDTTLHFKVIQDLRQMRFISIPYKHRGKTLGKSALQEGVYDRTGKV